MTGPTPQQLADSSVALERIGEGEWDFFLAKLYEAVTQRIAMTNHAHPPNIPLRSGLVWAWMKGPGTPHWEKVGTGAVISDEASAEMNAIKLRVRLEEAAREEIDRARQDCNCGSTWGWATHKSTCPVHMRRMPEGDRGLEA